MGEVGRDFIFAFKWQLGSMVGIALSVCLYGLLGMELVVGREGRKEFSGFGVFFGESYLWVVFYLFISKERGS